MKFSLSNNKTKNLLFLGFSFISSFLILMICSRSSFLYPMNDWVDAQCFFTVGKAMGNGQVVYRDIFEQKGILLYVLHMFAYFISHTTFIGVFFLEVIAGTAFLFINIKLINLYTDFRYAVLSASLCSLLIYASRAFCKGDSAEELCLPLLAYALYLSVKAFKTEKWLDSCSCGMADKRKKIQSIGTDFSFYRTWCGNGDITHSDLLCCQSFFKLSVGSLFL